MSTLNRPVLPGNYNVSSKDTIPASITLTGTYSSVGTVVTGVGTLFKTEILDTKVQQPKLRCHWLFDPATVTVREISHVLSDTSLILKQAFPSNVAGGTSVKCPDPTIDYLEISVISPIAGGIINGSSVLAGSTITWANDNGINPVAIDGTTSNMQIEIKR